MMKFLRKLAVLVLPVVAAITLVGPASAAPTTGSASSTGSSATALEGYIYNRWSRGLGVISTWRGLGNLYDLQLYDAVLPSKRRTDTAFGWSRAQGYYIGPGYCAAVWGWTGSAWTYFETRGSGQHRLPYNNYDPIQRFEVQSHPC
jgi:hypothetical protein